MSKTITTLSLNDFSTLFTIDKCRITIGSRHVAETFGKQHKHVIRDIENLECSQEFSRSNFGLSNYIDKQGKIRTEYQLTRDGFVYLVMGFTGAKAAKFKELYIQAFNKLEEMYKKSLRKELKSWQLLTDKLDVAERDAKSYVSTKRSAPDYNQVESTMDLVDSLDKHLN